MHTCVGQRGCSESGLALCESHVYPCLRTAFVCMCMRTCVLNAALCMHACACARACPMRLGACAFECTSAYAHACVCARACPMRRHVHAQLCAHLRTRTHVHAHVHAQRGGACTRACPMMHHVHVHMHICVHTRMCMRTCMPNAAPCLVRWKVFAPFFTPLLPLHPFLRTFCGVRKPFPCPSTFVLFFSIACR